MPEAHSYEVPDAYQGEPKTKGRSRAVGSHSVARLRDQLDQRFASTSPAELDTTPSPSTPSAEKKPGKPQPPANPTPVRLSDEVTRLGIGTGPRTPIYYTVKGKEVFVDDRDRSSAGTKPATVETGAEIQVPLFLNTGDKVKVDTRSGSYISRVND